MLPPLIRTIIISDPSYLEEKRSEANLVFGLNSYRELCGLHFGGITLASLEQLIKCANQGAKRANAVVKQIKAALEADENRRSTGEHVGFMRNLQSDRFNSHNEDRLFVRLAKFQLNPTDEMEQELEELKQEQTKIKSLGNHSAILMPAEELSSEDEYGDSWIPDHSDDDLTPIDTTMNQSSEKKVEKKQASTKKPQSTIEPMSGDSEEDETITMKQIT